MDKQLMGTVHEDYHYSQRILLMYTDKCTSQCEHCSAMSHPTNNKKMSVDEAKVYLQTAVSKGFKWVLWTGGEVFIYYEEIVELTQYGQSLGLIFSVDTNAFWASSEEKALQMLLPLKKYGVVHMDVSSDAFHSKYVDVQNVISAVRAALKVGISTRATFTYSGDSQIDDVLLNTLKKAEIPFSTSCLARVGLAKNLPLVVFGNIDMSQVGDCGELGPLVLPDGSVIGCCNPSVAPKSPIFIGGPDLDFFQKIDLFFQAPCIKYISQFGMKDIYQTVQNSPYASILAGGFSHPCELCETVFGHKEVNKLIQATASRKLAGINNPTV